jgi:hypothetical protein
VVGAPFPPRALRSTLLQRKVARYQQRIAAEQRWPHAVVFGVQDMQLRRAGLEAALYPGLAEMAVAAQGVIIFGRHRAADH